MTDILTRHATAATARSRGHRRRAADRTPGTGDRAADHGLAPTSLVAPPELACKHTRVKPRALVVQLVLVAGLCACLLPTCLFRARCWKLPGRAGGGGAHAPMLALLLFQPSWRGELNAYRRPDWTGVTDLRSPACAVGGIVSLNTFVAGVPPFACNCLTTGKPGAGCD